MNEQADDALTTTDAVCRLCDAPALVEFSEFRGLRRVTSDCRPWPSGGRLFHCARCGGVQKVADAAWQRETDAIYAGYAIYHQAEGAEQVVFDQASGSAASRSQRLLDSLRVHLPLPSRGRMLDVGCGNGAMLRAFHGIAPDWSLVGTELNEKYRTTVEGIPGVERLYTCLPDQVPGDFDVVTMIHVLEHIAEPQGFLGAICGKLSAGGMLLVELPHHVANPFELLIADHCTHFTAATATALLEAAGLVVLRTAEDWVPKELTIVARKPEREVGSQTSRLDVPTSASSAGSQAGVGEPATRLRWLTAIAANAKSLAAREPLGLFGTSIAAAWLFGELNGAVEFFVDEDAGRVGRKCLDRPIYHPQQIPPGSHVFVPLPTPLAESIRRRVARSDVSFHLPEPLPVPPARKPRI